MGLETRYTNEYDEPIQNDETGPAVNCGSSGSSDIETGFHILAKMIADFHLRRKDSNDHNSLEEKPSDTPG